MDGEFKRRWRDAVLSDFLAEFDLLVRVNGDKVDQPPDQLLLLRLQDDRAVEGRWLANDRFNLPDASVRRGESRS
jgi:hypothetical protein